MRFFINNSMTTAFAALMVSTMMIFNTGCGGSNASDSSSNSTTGVFTISPANPTVVAGGTIQINISGGTSPYYFAVLTPNGGSFQSGTNLYTAPTSLTTSPMNVSVQLYDSANNTTTFTIVVTGTASNGLAISPVSPTVATSDQITFAATGGTAPYTYSVITAGGGSFAGAVYTAPTTTGTYVVQVKDALNAISQTSVLVTNASSTLTCEGTYDMVVPNGTATLTIIQNSAGVIAGSIKPLTGYSSTTPMAISGTCTINASGGSISFTNQASNTVYAGTIYTAVNSGSTKLLIYGTYSSQNLNWSAKEQ